MSSRSLLRLALLACAAAPLVAVLPGCSSGEAADSNVIKIVSSMPRTGSAKAQTDTVVNGIKMALDEAGWKAGPFTLEYLDWDDATAAAGSWVAEAETANAERAARNPDVMAYIGTFNSGAAKVAMPILNRANLLMISPANTAPGLTKPGLGEAGEPGIYRPTGKVNYVRVVPADDLQGPLGADWAKEMGVKKVYVLDDNEVYGRGIAVLFKERCQEIGIEVLGHDSIDARASEFKSLMATIKAKGPDLVYFGGTTQTKGGQLARDLVAAGMNCKFMVPDGCMEDAFIEAAGADVLNGRCYVTFGGLPPDKLTGPGKVFVEKYQKRYGTMPEAYAIYGYEAAKVAIAAIAKAGKKDRAAIVDACLSIRDFDGALGRWSFDANGDTTLTTMSGNIVRDGRFEFVKMLGK
jgi:branched-chain amino acid transport system substrate-binding protein